VEQSLTVASERLDCIVAAVCGTSRNTAEEMLENSLVSLNSVITRKGTAKVSEGDKITVRGYGKFYIKSIGGTTKKGRLKITTQKYI
jgi:RNA-binding protein YlmH